MKALVIKHGIIQILLILFYVRSTEAIIGLNAILTLVGVDTADSHASLGVYLHFILAVLLPIIYFVATEMADKKEIVKHLNMGIVRIEISLLSLLCFLYAYSEQL